LHELLYQLAENNFARQGLRTLDYGANIQLPDRRADGGQRS
jgi:hypothetical protein